MDTIKQYFYKFAEWYSKPATVRQGLLFVDIPLLIAASLIIR